MNKKYQCPVCHADKGSTGKPFPSARSVALHIGGKIKKGNSLHLSWAITKVDREKIMEAKRSQDINNFSYLLEWIIEDIHASESSQQNRSFFYIDSLSSLLDEVNPDLIFLADTNTVMDYPDFSKWTSNIEDISIVYVFPPSIILELESLKTKNNIETQKKARAAVNAINELTNDGEISKGVYIKDCGWFITIPPPPDPDISDRNDIMQHFGRSDTLLLLLAQELNRRLESFSSIFLTSDKNLHNLISSHGAKSLLMRGFPLDATQFITNKSIDWENILKDLLENEEE